MIGTIESLPWQALRLSSRDIPWTELRALALAAAQSGDVRTKLVTEADRAIDEAESNYYAKSYNFADFAVPAVFALAAAKLDSEGKKDAAKSLLHLLYRAGETDSDYLLETAVAAAGVLGPAIVEPALDLFADHTWQTLECWYHLTSLLKCAKHADDSIKQRVIQFCRKHLSESPDRFERWSAAYPLAHVLAELNHTDSLPLLRELFNVSEDADLREAIAKLEGKLSPFLPYTAQRELWESPVETWLPQRVRTLHDWVEENAGKETQSAKADHLPDENEDDEELDVSDILSPSNSRLESESTIRRDYAKVGRNEPCPCHSGKKYKKCCGR